MTPTQTEILNKLKTDIIAQDSFGHEKEYEYKRFHVMEFPGERWVCLHSIVGPIGDEGTLASMLWRKERVMWIGARGRVIWLNEKEPYQAPILTLDTALKEPYRVGRGQAQQRVGRGHA